MNRLLKLIVDDFATYARECAENWDAIFGRIDRTLTSWASRQAPAVSPAEHEIDDDDEPFPLMDEQFRSEDPILDMQRLGLLDHRSSWDATATDDIFDDSTSPFDDESMFCNSLDQLNDPMCMFDNSSTGDWE